jgi:outer membrane protein OmpA-like peptidoglycan-associated protein
MANTVIKVLDIEGNLIDTVMTKEDGSFTYKKLRLDEEMVLQVETQDELDLVGGIVYLVGEDKERSRFFIREGNTLVHPSAMGKETIYGSFTYKKLAMTNAVLEVLDQNGMPIDTIYTDEKGFFKYEKMKLDNEYSLKPIDLSDEDFEELELSLTNKSGKNLQTVSMGSSGKFKFDDKPLPLADQGQKKSSAKKTMKVDNKVIYFGFNQTAITVSEEQKLDLVAKSLSSNNKKVTLVGHTDNVDTEEVNQGVGLNRAKNVKEALVKRGVSASRISILSKGESEPKSSNTSANGRAQNRRVEITF